MLSFLLAVIVGVLIQIAWTLRAILATLRGEKEIPAGPEHYKQFDPKTETWEHFYGASALLLLEEKRRGETWDPKRESSEQFMSRGQTKS